VPTPQDSRLSSSSQAGQVPELRTALEVTVSYGDAVLDVRHLIPPHGLTVGEGKAVDLTVSTDQLPVSEFPLLRCDGEAFVLTFSEGQRGEIDLGDGAIHPLKWFQSARGVTRDPAMAKSWRYVLPRAARVTLRFDGVTLAMCFVTPPERLFEPKTHRDYRYAAGVLAASVLALLVMALTFVFESTSPETYVPAAGVDADVRTARLFGASITTTPMMALSAAPMVLGTLSEDDLAKALVPAQPALESCLRALDPNTFIDARLRIDGDGHVGSSDVRSVPEANTACLSEVLGALRFPPPIDGQASVELRFR
jgi:hypothetical protein